MLTELKLRILYVEDNPDDQLILKRSLKENLAFEPHIINVNTGTKGLNKIGKENFDLILLDYNLPDMTGIEFIKELNKKTIKTPIILITGKGSEQVAVEALKLGVRDYIVKDNITSKSLADNIKDLLMEATLSKNVDLETAKYILHLFEEHPIIKIDSIHTLISEPRINISVEKLVTTLKALSESNIVDLDPLRSVVACPDCGSLTPTLYLECPDCESTKMSKAEALEHFDCGNIDFRSNFDKGGGVLICPKCEKKLKVIGVDYRKIENWYTCLNNHFFGSPSFKFICPECNRRFPLEEMAINTLYQYKLTSSGRQILNLGVKSTELMENSQDKKSSQKT